MVLSDTWQLIRILETGLAMFAVIMGALWTYLVFRRERKRYPKATLGLDVQTVHTTSDGYLIHVEVCITNIGDVVFSSRYAEVCCRRVLPLEQSVYAAMKENKDPIGSDQQSINWPLHANREWHWESGGLDVEPGEFESLHADFIVPIDYQKLQFYFFIENSMKKKRLRQGDLQARAIGWTKTVYFDLKNAGTREKSSLEPVGLATR